MINEKALWRALKVAGYKVELENRKSIMGYYSRFLRRNYSTTLAGKVIFVCHDDRERITAVCPKLGGIERFREGPEIEFDGKIYVRSVSENPVTKSRVLIFYEKAK